MQDYKISAAVKRDPWSNDYGKFQTYAVQFEGSDTWVQWNKKFKGDEEPTPPKHGDEVYGEISNGKFKIGKKDGGFTPGASKPSFKPEPKKEWIPRDDDRIVAQFAIKTAASLAPSFVEKTGDLEKWIETEAKKFYAMVDRVKGGEKSEPVKEDLPPVDAYDDITGEIDMSKIPF